MSYVSPKIRSQFESLSVELKNEILSRNVHMENLHDLISVLETIVSVNVNEKVSQALMNF